MIKVEIKRKKDYLSGFKMYGHAEFDEYGKDIVCAAASMLAYNTIDTFTDILDLRDYIAFTIEENLINLDFKSQIQEINMHDSQLILKKFELGMKSLQAEYSDYLKIYYMEV